MQSLKIRNLAKNFGATQVLNDINVAIDPGEFLILVGPSGCGKSTLLNCIAGLEDVSSGEIWIGDRMVNSVPPKDRDIAMVFQSYALYPNMDVRGNISFGMEMRKVPKAEQAIRIADVARMLQMEHLLDRKPGQLSGGQRQRVAMGRALARSPGLFLFDEPLSNLDAKLRVDMRSEIKLLHQRTRITSVYVTHDQIEAMTLGSRVAIMKDGVIQQFGTPGELYQRPANLFVAGFIGSPSMNFIPVTLRKRDASFEVELTSDAGRQLLPVAASPRLLPYTDRALTLGIRPEALALAADGQDHLPCRVALVEPTGPDTLLLVRINGAMVTARVAPQDAQAPGAVVGVRVDIDKALLFDPQSGLRIGADGSSLDSKIGIAVTGEGVTA
ncbi:MAG: sn-glycerol-3-phosphate ABC transporter ATP-binding protein UgpC [Rhodoferax sp.]|nr:sn-glycerol-3-phosphate ABC transporter ATP-binding protein UgpC [Rhodoferax sp.]